MNHSNVSRARVPNRSRAFKDTLIGVESQLRWLAGSPRIYPCDTAARRRRKSHSGHDGRGREGGGAERGEGEDDFEEDSVRQVLWTERNR